MTGVVEQGSSGGRGQWTRKPFSQRQALRRPGSPSLVHFVCCLGKVPHYEVTSHAYLAEADTSDGYLARLMGLTDTGCLLCPSVSPTAIRLRPSPNIPPLAQTIQSSPLLVGFGAAQAGERMTTPLPVSRLARSSPRLLMSPRGQSNKPWACPTAIQPVAGPGNSQA